MMAFGAKIKLSVNTSGASAFRKEIQTYVDSATSSNPIKLKHFTVSMTAAERKQIIRDLQSYLASDSALKLKISKIDATGAVRTLRQQLQTMLSGLSITGLKEFLGADGANEAAKNIDKARQSTVEWAAQLKLVSDVQSRLASTYKTSLSGRNMLDASQIATITAEYNAWLQKVEALRAAKTAMSAEELSDLALEGVAIQQKISQIQQETAAERQNAAEKEKAAQKELASSTQILSLRDQIQRYIMSNSKAYKVYGSQLDDIFKKLQTEAGLTNEELQNIRIAFANIKISARAAGVQGNTFFDTLKKGWEKFGGWSLVTRTMMAAYRVVRNMITSVKELDTAMTELKKVTDLSEQSYRNYLNTAKQLAQEVGATLTDTVNATADFARLGYSIGDATELAEAALIYKNVGDGIDDIGEASESIISTVKAFGVEVSNAMSIVDKFNEVGNNFAISSQGIGIALQKSASSLAAANNTLNESIALVTGMNAVLQNPEVVGTALKTVSMYLRAAKTEAEEAGEATDGMANSVSELRAELLQLTHGKVDIMIDDSTFKSTYQIMKELANVWDELADVDTANILELIGGKRNATAVTSLLNNFQDAEDALKSASQAAGSATAENEKYLESIAGKLDVLKAKFESFSNTFLSSGLVKGIIDIGSGILTACDYLAKFNLLLPVTIMLINLIKAAKMYVEVAKSSAAINALINQLVTEKVATDALKVSYNELSVVQQRYVAQKLKEAVASGQLTKAEYEDIAAKIGLTTVTLGAKGATDALNVSIKSLLLSNPVGWIILAISVLPGLISLISSAVGGFKSAEEKIKELDDEFEELSANIKGIADEYRSLKSSAEDVIPRFVELAKGVDDFGRNVSLTDEEYSEFLELNNKLAEMFPELNLGMDSNGNAMLSLSYSAQTLSDSLWGLVEAQRAASNKQIADEELPKLIENATDTQDQYNKKIDEYTEKIRLIKSLTPDGIGAFMNTDAKTMNTYAEFIKQTGVNASYKYNPDFSDPQTGTYSVSTSWYQFDEDAEKFEEAVKQFVSDQEKLIENTKQEIAKKWKSVLPSITAWMQTESNFNSLDSDIQSILTKMLGNIDLASLKIEGTEDMKSQIKEWLIDPIAEATPEVQAIVKDLFDKMTSFNTGEMTFSQYQMAVDGLIQALKDAGFSDKFINTLTLTLNIDDIYNKADKVRDLLKDEYKDAVDDFSAEEIELAYEVKAADGSLTLDELKREILEIKTKGAEMIEVLDFTPMTDKFNSITSGLNNIISAMEKLREGSALTKVEVAKLALEYPKLLEKANLFTTGTIEGQNSVLQNLLDNYEAEYDATIEAKIAELEATNECLNAQMDLENRKLNVVFEIKEAEVNGELESKEWLLNKIAEFNDLQGRNYVSMENGILTVNEEALNAQMKNANAAAQENADAWHQSASDVTSFYNASANASVEATSQAQEKIRKKINGIGDWFHALWDTICRLFSTGKWEWGVLEQVWDDTEINVDLNADLKSKYNYNSIDNKTISDWVSSQEQAIADRLEDIKDQYQINLNIIDNLRNLKGLDLTSLYGSKGGEYDSSKSKEVDEYFADVDEYYAAVKRLEEAQEKKSKLEKLLEHTEDPLSKIGLEGQLIEAYKEEADAERALMTLKQRSIAANVEALRQLGFQVDYNSDTNRLFIRNLEHINELTATSAGKYETLQEATNALRKETEELIDITEELNKDNIESVDNIEDLTYEILDAKNNIIDYIEEIYKKQIDAYKDIIEQRKEAIKSAKDEYDYESDVADKVKEIAELQARIDQLSLDNSREAQAERNALLEELNEKNKELADTQGEHAYDKQLDALDKMADAYEEEKNNEVEILRSTVNSTEEVWNAFYQSILGKNVSIGDSINKEIVNAWLNAAEAVKAYSNSIAGITGAGTILGTVPKFHSGGVVGQGNISKEEMLAVLQKGEVILNDSKQDSLYEIIDFQSELAKRLGRTIGNIDIGGWKKIYPGLRGTVGDILPIKPGDSSSVVFEPYLDVSIYHNGAMTDADAKRYGEQLANTAIEKLYGAFERKGVSGNIGSKLKP